MGYKPVEYCSWGPNLFADQKRSISISVDEFHFDDLTDYKVFVQAEPPEVLPRVKRTLIENRKFYDLILAWDEDILRECPNAIRYVFGSTHDPGSLDRVISKYRKDFAVSFLTSSKDDCPGHKLRREIYRLLPGNFGKVRIEKHMSPPWLADKSSMLDLFQYSIVVENAKRDNWIASATIDCFLTKTIPIFWGCPNIGEFFNTDGIIRFDSPADLMYVLAGLSSGFYQQHWAAVEQNYQTAIGYLDLTKRIDAILRGVL